MHNGPPNSPPELADVQALISQMMSSIGSSEVLPPNPPLKQLAIQGGGAKGAGYPEVVAVLDEQGYLEDVDIVVGASAGAITAFGIGLGFNGEQFAQISAKMNFLDFTSVKKNGWAAHFNGHKAGNVMDLLQYGAAFTGDSFHDWATFMVEQILGDPNATFADLHHARMKDPALKDMIFKATRYNAKKGEVIEQTFSYKETPNIRIADAVRASMAFPGAFAPKTVRYKDGKVFGVFADGGILNNYPIDELNRQEYYDAQYQPIEKMDHHGKPHQINPCSVGLSLTQNLDNLDENITPLTPRLRKLKQEKKAKKAQPHPPEKNEDSDISDVSGEWRYNDILKAILWKKIGVPIREETKQKHKLYSSQTVQIYTEDVKTLEFDAPKAKLDRLRASNRNAMTLWLEKFRDPTVPYAYPDKFDDRLTAAEKLLKKNNPEGFYQQKLTRYYIELLNELKKAKLQGKDSEKDLLKNVRCRYLSANISKMLNDMNDKKSLESTPQGIEKRAFADATKKIQNQSAYMKAQQDMRWHLIHHDKLIELISEKLLKSPKEGLRILRGQLSNVIPLIREKKGGNLLSIAVQSGDPKVAVEVFKIVNDALQQCYYQGRSEDIKYSLVKMLNELAHPPLFSVLAGMQNPQMVNVVLNHGVDPLFKSPLTGHNGLQEMILANDFVSFRAIVLHCSAKGIDLMNVRFGDKSLMHYILNHPNQSFLEKLRNDKEVAKLIMNYHIKDGAYNDIVHEAARRAKSADDEVWRLVQAFSPRRHLQFDKLKKEGTANVNAHRAKMTLAHEAYNAIISSSLSESRASVIEELNPQVCFNILHSYVKGKGELRLCQLAKDPSKADIFIQLCEKAYSDRRTYKHLLEILNQKIDGKTALYYAAEAGNTRVVDYLRKSKFDCDINDAGPVEAPCALMAAARNGHGDTVSALIKSIPWGLRLGYNSVSRRKPDYHYKRTPLHYLAMYGTPEAFCDVLYGGGMRSSPTKVALMKDSYGKTPFEYLVENNRMDILKAILEKGKGKYRGYIFNSDYRFAKIFGWHFDSKEGYSELEFAKRVNPEMYDYICKNLSFNKAKTHHIVEKVEHDLAHKVDAERVKSMSTSEEAANMELSTLGMDAYDDWVMVENESHGKRVSVQEISQKFEEPRVRERNVKFSVETKDMPSDTKNVAELRTEYEERDKENLGGNKIKKSK